MNKRTWKTIGEPATAGTSKIHYESSDGLHCWRDGYWDQEFGPRFMAYKNSPGHLYDPEDPQQRSTGEVPVEEF